MMTTPPSESPPTGKHSLPRMHPTPAGEPRRLGCAPEKLETLMPRSVVLYHQPG